MCDRKGTTNEEREIGEQRATKKHGCPSYPGDKERKKKDGTRDERRKRDTRERDGESGRSFG